MPPGSFSTAARRSSRFLAWAWLRTFWTTRSELDETIKGRNAISDFLTSALSHSSDHFALAKEIWDISAIAYLLDESYMLTEIPRSPAIRN